MAHKTLHRAFNELLHPRDDRGRFTKKGTGSTKWVDKMIGKHDLNLGFTQDHAPKGRLPGGLLVNTPAKKRVAERAIESAGEHAGKSAGRSPGGSVVKRLDNSIAKPEHGGMPEKRSTSKLDRLEKQIEVQRGKVAMAKEARVNRGGRIQSSRETAATRKLHDLQVEASKERASQAAGPDAPRSGLAQVADDMHALHKEVFPDGVPDFAVGDKVHYNGSGLAVAPKEYTVSKKLPLGGLVLTRTDQNGREVNITVSPVDVQRDQTLTARAKASTEQARKEAAAQTPDGEIARLEQQVQAQRLKVADVKAKRLARGEPVHSVEEGNANTELAALQAGLDRARLNADPNGHVERARAAGVSEKTISKVLGSGDADLQRGREKTALGGPAHDLIVGEIERRSAKRAAPKVEAPGNSFAADMAKELGNKEPAFNKQIRSEVAAKRAAAKQEKRAADLAESPGGGIEGNVKPTDAATLTLERAYAMHGTDEAAWSARTKRDMEKLRKAAGITTTPKVTANRPGRTPGGMANKVPAHNADGGNKLDRSLDGGDAGGMAANTSRKATTTYTATHNGQTVTRKSVKPYTHASVVRYSNGDENIASFHTSEAAAARGVLTAQQRSNGAQVVKVVPVTAGGMNVADMSPAQKLQRALEMHGTDESRWSPALKKQIAKLRQQAGGGLPKA